MFFLAPALGPVRGDLQPSKSGMEPWNLGTLEPYSLGTRAPVPGIFFLRCLLSVFQAKDLKTFVGCSLLRVPGEESQASSSQTALAQESGGGWWVAGALSVELLLMFAGVVLRCCSLFFLLWLCWGEKEKKEGKGREAPKTKKTTLPLRCEAVMPRVLAFFVCFLVLRRPGGRDQG